MRTDFFFPKIYRWPMSIKQCTDPTDRSGNREKNEHQRFPPQTITTTHSPQKKKIGCLCQNVRLLDLYITASENEAQHSHSWKSLSALLKLNTGSSINKQLCFYVCTQEGRKHIYGKAVSANDSKSIVLKSPKLDQIQTPSKISHMHVIGVLTMDSLIHSVTRMNSERMLSARGQAHSLHMWVHP